MRRVCPYTRPEPGGLGATAGQHGTDRHQQVARWPGGRTEALLELLLGQASRLLNGSLETLAILGTAHAQNVFVGALFQQLAVLVAQQSRIGDPDAAPDGKTVLQILMGTTRFVPESTRLTSCNCNRLRFTATPATTCCSVVTNSVAKPIGTTEPGAPLATLKLGRQLQMAPKRGSFQLNVFGTTPILTPGRHFLETVLIAKSGLEVASRLDLATLGLQSGDVPLGHLSGWQDVELEFSDLERRTPHTLEFHLCTIQRQWMSTYFSGRQGAKGVRTLF